MVRAEDVYTALLRNDAAKVGPSARGTVTYKLEGREVSAD